MSEFKPFAAGGGLSVHDAPLGGVNEPIGEGEAKSADEELANSVELRFAGISLEQVSLHSSVRGSRLIRSLT